MVESRVRKRYELIEWVLDERQRRLLAAAETQVLGHGGITAVSKATGISRPSIHAGIKELSTRTQQEDLAGFHDTDPVHFKSLTPFPLKSF